jgi:hypothetical protein
MRKEPVAMDRDSASDTARDTADGERAHRTAAEHDHREEEDDGEGQEAVHEARPEGGLVRLKRVHGVRKRFLEQDAIDERMEALQKKRQKQGNDLQRWLKKIEGKKGDAARKALEMIVKEARQIALDEAAQE